MATHSSILAWRIPWTEEFGGLQSMGSQTARYDWVVDTVRSHTAAFIYACVYLCMHLFVHVFIRVFICACVYFCMRLFVCVFISATPSLCRCTGLPLVPESGIRSPRCCAASSLQWLLLLPSTGSGSTGFSSCSSRAELFRLAGFSSCILRAQLLRDMWNLPGPRIEPESPALASRFHIPYCTLWIPIPATREVLSLFS